ncbi:MAG: PQQ-binding-like beta-propeller repeat protein [Actinobacteria bacterium]|nr:PQQ-binding-like beta-propeller repeat protein [Actinomycetota bacterium]
MPSLEEPTHYERLQVDDGATTDDIRRAYRALAKVAHPDAGGDADEFRLLTEAYETLCNPLLRREYDDRLSVEQFVQGGSFGRPHRPGRTATDRSWRARSAGSGGWTGTDGDFTGDVEFPSYLRDIADAPWAKSAETASQREQNDAEREARFGAKARAADILWWSPDASIVPPTLAGQVVVMATGDAVLAVDAFHGRYLWRAETVAAAAAPAAFADETVIVWTEDGVLHGFELGRGVTRWEATVGPPGRGQLTVVNDLVAATTETHLLAFDSLTGKPRWNGSLVAPPAVPAVTVGSTIVVGTERGVDAFDVRKGKARWRAPSHVPINVPLCPARDSVWVSAGGGKLHRMDIQSGAGVSTWDVGSPIAGLVADGHTLFATVVGPAQLVAVDPNGWVRWATALAATSPEPALIAGTAYVAEPSGKLIAIDTVDGEVIGGMNLPFAPFGPPLGFVDRIIVQERGGHLWCADLPGWLASMPR